MHEKRAEQDPGEPGEAEKAAEKVSQGRAPYTLLDKVKNGKLQVQQGIIAGCAGGTYSNIVEAANLLRGKSIGAGEFTLSVYPSSLPVYTDLADKGYLSELIKAGAVVEYAIVGENCVVEENAHIGRSPEEFSGDSRENWGIAVTGHNITVSAGKEVAPKQILSESV